MSYAAAVGSQRPRHASLQVAQESLTATLTASNDVKCLELLKTIHDTLGKRDVTCFQPLGRNQYAISFSTDAALQRALALTTTHKVESVIPVNGRVRIRCFNVPPYGEWSPLLDALRVYGTVEDHFSEMYNKFPDVATGCRIVVMKFNDPLTSTSGPLPETLKILGRIIRFDYGGVLKSCFACKGKGHNARDCPTKTTPVPEKSSVPEATPVSVTTPPAAPTTPEVGAGESTDPTLFKTISCPETSVETPTLNEVLQAQLTDLNTLTTVTV